MPARWCQVLGTVQQACLQECTTQVPRSCLWVSQDDQAKLGTGEGHIKPAGVAEEANALVIIGADAGQNDVVLLAALEGVHAAHLHLRACRSRRFHPDCSACRVIDTAMWVENGLASLGRVVQHDQAHMASALRSLLLHGGRSFVLNSLKRRR